jgi:hypothetical protein
MICSANAVIGINPNPLAVVKRAQEGDFVID